MPEWRGLVSRAHCLCFSAGNRSSSGLVTKTYGERKRPRSEDLGSRPPYRCGRARLFFTRVAFRSVDAESGADLSFDLRRELLVLGEELLGVVASLAEPGLAVGEEGAGLRDEVVLDAEVEQLSLARDAGAVLDVEF